MDDERIEKRLATSLGLKRDDVVSVAGKSKHGGQHALVLFLPEFCGDTSHRLADAMNEALNIEGGLGNEALLDLFAARAVRFRREGAWYEKLWAALDRRFLDRKYARCPRVLVFADVASDALGLPERPGQKGVVIFTGGPGAVDRAEPIVEVLEKHEDALRSIVRHAAPTHHLLPMLAPERPPLPMPAAFAPTGKKHSWFDVSCVDSEATQLSIRV